MDRQYSYPQDTINKLRDSLGKLVAIVELYHKEAGDCDHSVGICLCGEKRDLAEAKELLEKLWGAKMNKYTCATCGTKYIGDIPDSWFTRGDPKNEIHFCSRVCLEIKLLDDEYKMFEDTNKYRLTFPWQ